MIKEALQYITGLKAESLEPKVLEIEGETYCTKNLTRYHNFPRGYLTGGECLPVEVSKGVSGRYCQNDGIKLYIVNIGF